MQVGKSDGELGDAQISFHLLCLCPVSDVGRVSSVSGTRLWVGANRLGILALPCATTLLWVPCSSRPAAKNGAHCLKNG